MDSSHFQYPQHQAPRSSFSHGSSPSGMHSTFESLNSPSSLASISTSPSQTNMHSRQSPVLSSAPLSSPSAARQPSGGNYFGAMSTTAPQQSHQAFQQMQSFPTSQQAQQQTSSHQYHGQRGGGGGMPETAPYLQDFSLLAEAAKRAQMACLMRDLDEFEM